MERLTFDGLFCDIAKCKETPGGTFCEDGACSQRKVWERLKQYEDTGLEPEQVSELKGFIQGGIHKVDDGWVHVQELLDAERRAALWCCRARCGIRCTLSLMARCTMSEYKEFLSERTIRFFSISAAILSNMLGGARSAKPSSSPERMLEGGTDNA